MNIQSGFLVFIFLFNFFLSANISSQTTSSEQKFENAGAQLLWPVNCLSQSGLERLWSSSRNGVYQDTIGVDAVWGSIRKASVIDGQRVVIKGYVGGSVCELFSDAPKREYIWRTESIRDKEAISVYINVRQKTSTARMSKYFKVNYLDDYRFDLSVPLDDFFSPEDAQKVRLGEVLKDRQFYLLFKLNIDRDNNTPAFYRFTYDVMGPQGRISDLKINSRD
jgi:hypothetical protein